MISVTADTAVATSSDLVLRPVTYCALLASALNVATMPGVLPMTKLVRHSPAIAFLYSLPAGLAVLGVHLATDQATAPAATFAAAVLLYLEVSDL